MVIVAELYMGRTKNEVKNQLNLNSINNFLTAYEPKILARYITLHFKCLLRKYKVNNANNINE